ncbi:hypothetical protein [Candidatus Phytoplasma citri]|uniref:Uncharacterized protein n=1 Tax=Candidatus Phytoplasma citri TaxID=180978 RepID=A0ABU8ZR02_9MOLU
MQFKSIQIYYFLKIGFIPSSECLDVFVKRIIYNQELKIIYNQELKDFAI